ncbi:hypothetical protein RI129_013112 [Pyrocoelia pectoralis]|uniref:CN hydrolase domain-containing protein n=1 Tax=Pyrocoelia pectoralis TaxID=417401 RepID=A0AAN7UZT3_9COLE
MKVYSIVIFIYLHYFWRVEAHYTAAVIEFFPVQDRHLPAEEKLHRNINGYVTILDELSHTTKLDIIVYPEATLTANSLFKTHADVSAYSIEVNVNETSLCDTPVTTFLTPLACAAVKYQTYIALNLYERAPCTKNEETKCSEDGWSFYNTNIVFNRKGVIVSKYRKYNLFGEIYMTRPKKADISIFRTDFNETFAMFICFDILFRQPSLDLVNKYHVKSILYSSMWFSELPFLTALQTQQQWAYATDVTFLASGANNRKVGSGGTGIYHGMDGPLLFTIVGSSKSKGLVAKIPGTHGQGPKDTNTIDKKGKEMDEFHLLSDHLEPYASKLILPNGKEIVDKVCSGEGTEFCCHFKVELEWEEELMNEDKDQYQYHMVAFSGVRSFAGVSNGGVEICAIVACVNESLSSCGKRFPNYNNISWRANFKKIVINAEFDIDDNKFQFPNSLLSNIEPINVDALEWTSVMNNKRIRRTYKLKKPQNRLMTFGIYGRDFNRDSSIHNPLRQIFYL